jgi:hypothetical protein
MKPFHGLRPLPCTAAFATTAASPVTAQSTYDIPAGAHFNAQKLGRLGDYPGSEVTEGSGG